MYCICFQCHSKAVGPGFVWLFMIGLPHRRFLNIATWLGRSQDKWTVVGIGGCQNPKVFTRLKYRSMCTSNCFVTYKRVIVHPCCEMWWFMKQTQLHKHHPIHQSSLGGHNKHHPIVVARPKFIKLQWIYTHWDELALVQAAEPDVCLQELGRLSTQRPKG